MKILKKQQINERVNQERKNVIDSGVFLAKKVDALREEMLTLEKNRDLFIAGSKQVINDSLQELETKQDTLKKEIRDLEAKRKESLKPLDEAWKEVERIKKQFEQRQEENLIDRQQINEDKKQIENTKSTIARIAEQTRYKESETEKVRSEVIGLRDSTQREKDNIEYLRKSFDAEHTEKLSKLQTKIETYENGVSVNERKAKELEEKEVALLSERKHLESQQRTFQIAKGIK